jgi:hypothetical protein
MAYKPPMPSVQTFLTCADIFFDPHKRMTLLLGPTAHVPVPMFPAHVHLAIFIEVTSGHGSYLPRFCLRDDTGEEVWGVTMNAPFEQADPLRAAEVRFNAINVAVSKAGRYNLVLLLNGVEAAERTMWFGG